MAAPDSQIWVRRDRDSPRVVDMPLTPDRDGLWTWLRDAVRRLDTEHAWLPQLACVGVRPLGWVR